MSNITAIILAAGRGTRADLSYNKVLHMAGHTTVLEMVLDKFIPIVNHICVVYNEDDNDQINRILSTYKNTKDISDDTAHRKASILQNKDCCSPNSTQTENLHLCRTLSGSALSSPPILSSVCGGKTRFESVKRALNFIQHCDIVTIHDAARPFVEVSTILDSIQSAKLHGSGIASAPVTDTIKMLQGTHIVHLDRDNLVAVQTPQSFVFSQILHAYNNASHSSFTDDASVYYDAGYSVNLSKSEYTNIKVTTHNDILKLPSNLRVGIGYDVHRLTSSRQLILGGVMIAHSLGLDGHSDADVLTHAIMDALLSAAGLPDIGILFDNTDQAYKNANSILLLQQVHSMIVCKGYSIVNIAGVIIAQQPKLSTTIPLIEHNLAQSLNISHTQINISATTTEGLGIVGNNEGMASSATCLLQHNS